MGWGLANMSRSGHFMQFLAKEREASQSTVCRGHLQSPYCLGVLQSSLKPAMAALGITAISVRKNQDMYVFMKLLGILKKTLWIGASWSPTKLQGIYKSPYWGTLQSSFLGALWSHSPRSFIKPFLGCFAKPPPRVLPEASCCKLHEVCRSAQKIGVCQPTYWVGSVSKKNVVSLQMELNVQICIEMSCLHSVHPIPEGQVPFFSRNSMKCPGLHGKVMSTTPTSWGRVKISKNVFFCKELNQMLRSASMSYLSFLHHYAILFWKLTPFPPKDFGVCKHDFSVQICTFQSIPRKTTLFQKLIPSLWCGGCPTWYFCGDLEISFNP